MRLSQLILLLAFAVAGLPVAAGAQVLYWLDTNFTTPTLNKADALGNAIASVGLPNSTLPEGLATYSGGKVFWAEACLSGARIQRAAPTLASITTLVSGGSALRGVAVDDAAGTIYWTSSNLVTGSRITRSALNGSGAIILNSLGAAANPRGIAVDHAGGKIYWADFDQDAIYRANLDGTLMELWQSLPANSHPYGVAFDPVGQIYWTEYAGKIRRAPTAGGASVTLLASLSNPTYIALNPAGGQMYWSEGGAGAQHIYRAPMIVGGSRTTLALPLTTYGGLAFQPNAIVSTPPDVALPQEFALAPLSPNPSAGPVRAEFALPHESQVRLSVIDLQGREVSVLVDGTLPAGRHEASWKNINGRPIPAGVYFVRLAAEGRAWSRRLTRIP